AGRVKIDLSYFNYQYGSDRKCSAKFYRAFGKPRKNGASFEENHVNLAAAVQKVLEDKILKICRILKARTKSEYLVLSGGVALNSVMNGRILQEGIFKDLF